MLTLPEGLRITFCDMLLQAWKAFYANRWQPTEPTSEHGNDKEGHSLTWQTHYGRKMRIQRVFGGRARQDSFFGHKGGIKCLGLLPGHNLMATGDLAFLPQAGACEACSCFSDACGGALSGLRLTWLSFSNMKMQCTLSEKDMEALKVLYRTCLSMPA